MALFTFLNLADEIMRKRIGIQDTVDSLTPTNVIEFPALPMPSSSTPCDNVLRNSIELRNQARVLQHSSDYSRSSTCTPTHHPLLRTLCMHAGRVSGIPVRDDGDGGAWCLAFGVSLFCFV